MKFQETYVCVLTARGMSAIASVALAGGDAQTILKNIFRLSSGKEAALIPGGVGYGSIVDGSRVIDEVLVGCEGADALVIHCHGNPLLVEQIVKLCQSKGATLVDTNSFVFQRYSNGSRNTIQAEAKLATQQSATLLGVKIVQAQQNGGLFKWANDVLGNIDTLDVTEVHQQAERILRRSAIAERIIKGVRIVIAGPPNSGKSTLLNCLSGQQEVVVSDTAGTTRDWVSVTCRIGSVRAEFIDTAGLDDVQAGNDDIEQTAQQITKELLASCDLVVYVQDITTADSQSEIDSDKPVVTVYNKSDLAQTLRGSGAQELKSVTISAQDNTGIDALIEAILTALQINEISLEDPVVFTSRQQEILSCLTTAGNKTAVQTFIQGLLYAAYR